MHSYSFVMNSKAVEIHGMLLSHGKTTGTKLLYNRSMTRAKLPRRPDDVDRLVSPHRWQSDSLTLPTQPFVPHRAVRISIDRALLQSSNRLNQDTITAIILQYTMSKTTYILLLSGSTSDTSVITVNEHFFFPGEGTNLQGARLLTRICRPTQFGSQM